MINLEAKLGLNATAFTRGLASAVDGAKRAGGVAGKEVGKDFVKGLKRTIGAGAIAAAVVAELKDAQEVRNMAEALGVTNQEFAAMEIVSKRLGDTTNVTTEEFHRLMQAVITSGELAENNVFDELADSADKLDRTMRMVKKTLQSLLAGTMRGIEAVGGAIGGAIVNEKPGGGLVEGIKQRASQASREFSKVWNGEGMQSEDPMKGAKRLSLEEADKRRAELNAKAEKVERQKENKYHKPFAAIGSGADELAKMGLGAGRSGFNLQKQLLDEAKQTNRILKEVERAVR